MPVRRKELTKAVKEHILNEYNHRCAICGTDRPHIHHIDEDPSNNDLLNLLPLCPNCHLIDQHNPTVPVDPMKLQLFRRFKDPMILSSQFHPIFIRMKFLCVVDDETDMVEANKKATELVDFIKELEMGLFYSSKIAGLILKPPSPTVVFVGDPISEANEQKAILEQAIAYRQQLKSVQDEVYALIVEQLRFQKW